MERFTYKIYLFFLLITMTTYGQKKEVFLQKSYEVDEETVLELDLNNVSVILEESNDGKIHFDYSITFQGYSDTKTEYIKKQVKVKTKKRKNKVSLTVNNSTFIGTNQQIYISSDSLTAAFKDYIIMEKAKKNLYKTKDSLLSEIQFSEGSNLMDFLKKNSASYSKGPFRRKKLITKKFIIKVPKMMEIRLQGIHSNVEVKYDIESKFVANTFKGFLKFQKIESQDNLFSVTNGIFETQGLSGGSYNFKDMNKVLIGDISNAKLTMETSKVQIGQVGRNVEVNDFNSKTYFYNFSKDFSQFRYAGDYSKLSFYNVKDSNYSMDVYGQNTVLSVDDLKTVFGISEERKSTKILEKKPKEFATSQGNIKIELTNGILNVITDKTQ